MIFMLEISAQVTSSSRPLPGFLIKCELHLLFFFHRLKIVNWSSLFLFKQRSMGHLSTILKWLTRRRRRAKQERDGNGRDAADRMARDAHKNELVLRSSGTLNSASVFTKKGDKASNQDRCIVWEVSIYLFHYIHSINSMMNDLVGF